MATSSEDINTKLTFRLYKDGDHEVTDFSKKIFVEDTSYKCPTYVHRTPPCQGSCPSGEDIRGWLDIIRGIEKPSADMSMQEYAFRRSTEANPFPSIMGRVCPAPCQDGCNRNQVEDFVGINAVEQYIGDTALDKGFTFASAAKDTGKKVAIIGGGPAGLAAAYQLRLKGHACTIFDDHEDLGGMMRYGIPGYRTPREVLDGEIKRIIDMGVEVIGIFSDGVLHYLNPAFSVLVVKRDDDLFQLAIHILQIFIGSADFLIDLCRGRAD